MIAEVKIVDDCPIAQMENLPASKGTHCNQPTLKSFFFFQSESIEHEAAGDKQGDGHHDTDEGGHHQQVTDMMVANIYKIKGNHVESSMASSGGGFFQTIHIKHCLK